MFKIGDVVIYGNTGVCTVTGIGPSELSGADKDKDYYFLTPYYSPESRIYTPCDNDKVVMRHIISKKEAEELLDSINDIETVEISNEKERENIYKTMIRGCNCREIISILKTIYERKKQRLSEGKKITANDEKYFLMAEDKLHGELAVVLGIAKDQVKSYIASKAKVEF